MTVIVRLFDTMAVKRSGNVLGHINEVTLHQAQLVLGWVTVYRRVNYLGM